MNTNHEDYELIARRMDGEEVNLTAEQEALAEEMAADAQAVGAAMDVPLPGGTLHRVKARITPSRIVRRPVRLWLRRAGAAVAVAAAVIVAATFLLPSGHDGDNTKRPEHFASANGGLLTYNVAADNDLDLRVETLSDDLADARTALLMDDNFSTELAMASFEQEIDEFLLDEPGPESWMEH